MNFVSKYKINMLICLPILKDLICQKKRKQIERNATYNWFTKKKFDISNGIYYNGNYPCTVFVSVKILQNPQNIIILYILLILNSRYTNLNKEEYNGKQDFLG